MTLESANFQTPFGSASLMNRSQSLHFFSTLILPFGIVLSFVYLVLLRLHDRSPFCFITEILLVLTHEFVVTFLLLGLSLCQQLYNLLSMLTLGLVYSSQRLLNCADDVLVLFYVQLSCLFSQNVLLSGLNVFLQMLKLYRKVIVGKHLDVPIRLLSISLSLFQIFRIHFLQHRQCELCMFCRLLMLCQVRIDCADINVSAGSGDPIFNSINLKLQSLFQVSQGNFWLILPQLIKNVLFVVASQVVESDARDLIDLRVVGINFELLCYGSFCFLKVFDGFGELVWFATEILLTRQASPLLLNSKIRFYIF